MSKIIIFIIVLFVFGAVNGANATDTHIKEYVGIGIYLHKIKDQAVILSSVKNSPAKKAGLGEGDAIVAVNGELVKGLSINEISELIKGEEGSIVKLLVRRRGSIKKLEEIVITRQKITNADAYQLAAPQWDKDINWDLTPNATEKEAVKRIITGLQSPKTDKKKLLLRAFKLQDIGLRDKIMDNLMPENEKNIIELSKNKDLKIRKNVIRALRKFDSKDSIERLIHLLGHDEDWQVRREAAESLKILKSEIAVDPLIEALEDENSSVVWGAAEALRSIKSKRALKPLLKLFVRSDGLTGEYAIKDIVAVYPELAEEIIDIILPLISDPNAKLRASAVSILAATRSDEILDVLINASEDNSSAVRLSAVMGLMKFNKKEKAIDALIKATKDDYSFIRGFVVSRLEYNGNEKLLMALKAALKDIEPSVRSVAVSALGKSGALHVESQLVQMLNDPVPDVRHQAIESLWSLKDGNSVKVFLKVLEKDEDESVKVRAMKALIELKDTTSIDPLQQILSKANDPRTRKYAIDILGFISDEKSVPTIKNFLRDMDEGVRNSAKQALQRINKRSENNH